MTRTKAKRLWHFTQSWYSAHRGKWYRRQLHKAERAYARGYGRLRSVAHKASEVNWKGW